MGPRESSRFKMFIRRDAKDRPFFRACHGSSGHPHPPSAPRVPTRSRQQREAGAFNCKAACPERTLCGTGSSRRGNDRGPGAGGSELSSEESLLRPSARIKNKVPGANRGWPVRKKPVPGRGEERLHQRLPSGEQHSRSYPPRFRTFSRTFPMNCDCSFCAHSSPQTCRVPSFCAMSSSQGHR